MPTTKTYRKQKLLFFAVVILSTVAFVADVLYTAKHVTVTENVVLERWGIIITLAGIFSALKLLHPKLKEEDKSDKAGALKKYYNKYCLRLLLLGTICAFNLLCLYITGVKNFTYMAFISIFAMLLCAPNKKHIEFEIQKEKENENETEI